MQRIAILYDACNAVLSTFDLDEVLNQILAIARDYFRLRNGSILLLDDATNELRVRSYFGPRDSGTRHSIPFGQGITGTAARLKRPVYVPDVEKDARYIPGVPGTKCELAIPLMAQDKVVGVLDFQIDEANAFENETIDLLTLFAAQASIGIQNAKLYSLVQRRAAQLEALNAIAKQTTVKLDVRELLQQFCQQIPQSFPAQHVAVFLRDEDGNLVLRAQHGSLAGRLEEGELLVGAGRCAYAASADGKLQCGPVECPAPCFAGAQSEVCLPLVSSGLNLGMMVCVSDQPNAFPPNDVQVLESVADILATAVQNAQFVDRVRQLAYLDGLTGIFNRRYFDSRLIEEVTRASRYGGMVSMLMIDIDHFKNVNDDFGHLLGDEVLRQISAVFTRQLRKVDVVCRYGGEEFAIILPATQLPSAVSVATKLLRAVETYQFPDVPRPVTISIGVSEFPTNGRTRDLLVQAADDAMYVAKQAGRNRVECASGTASVVSEQ